MSRVIVLVESTGCKTAVSEEYYEKYKGEGITKIRVEEVPKPKTAVPKKRAPRKKPMSKEV